MSDLPLVSVIIPHWNGIDTLAECLESLRRSTYPRLEVIVVDNGSTDGSPDWLRERHPEITLVENDRNYGYAGGCNRGVPMSRGTYVLFLNNDTIQEPGWIEPLIERLEQNPHIAAVQPKILNYYQRERFDYAGGAGGHLDLLCFPFARGRIFLEQEVDRGQYDQAEPIFWASGTACLVRKKLFLEAGGFDETFFAHMEEIDLCWRLQLMGYEIWSEPRSVVYHKNAVSLPMDHPRKFYLNHRNSLFMLLANYSLPLALYLFPLRYLLEWVAFLYALTFLDWKHMVGIVRAQGWLLLHPRLIWRKHRRVKALRRIKDRVLRARFYKGSIVLAHYVGRKRTYREIVSSP
jgi:hypothetical protein